jgi:hypothetical protein
MAALKPKTRSELGVVEVGDELVVFDPAAELVHHLNPSAALVFGLCDGTATMRETSVELAAATGRPQDEVERDVRALVRELRRAELLERKPRARNGDAKDEQPVDQRGGIRKEVPRSD